MRLTKSSKGNLYEEPRGMHFGEVSSIDRGAADDSRVEGQFRGHVE